MSRKSQLPDPDLVSRHDQEIATLKDRWFAEIPAADRGVLETTLKADPWLSHQVITLIEDVFFAPQLTTVFLSGMARHLNETEPAERRPMLAGMIAVGRFRSGRRKGEAGA